MSLKFEVDAESFETLDESAKGLYKQDGEKYVLTVEGLPDVSGLKSKVDELLSEKKTAQKKAQEEIEEARRKAEESARQSGDYKSLFESLQSKYEEKDKSLSALQNQIGQEKINSLAMKKALEVAEGANAELFSEFLVKRLRYEDGKVKVTDQTGGLTVSSVDDLVKELEATGKYSALLKGNKSSGGGAAGSNSSGGAAKTMTREAFQALAPHEQMAFRKEGGTFKTT